MINFDSKKYWGDRYSTGGNSGEGSRGVLAEYKAATINKFVKDNNIQTVCELGCGDVQFLLYDMTNFTGYDISEFIIEENKKKFNYINLKFTSVREELISYDLLLSLDVILHLIEEHVYQDHIKDLFALSNKYVMIYSPDRDESFNAPHNKYRKFSKDVPLNWKLKQLIENPHKGELTQADFYIFEKC